MIETLELEVKLWQDDKERAGVFAQIGRIHEKQLGDVEQAMNFYESALTVDPECLPANQALFEHWFDHGEWEKAAPIGASLARRFPVNMPELIVEPGRCIVGDAGVIQSEVVLVAHKGGDDARRWVYLDVGKFHGLAETMDEAIKYRLLTPHDGTESGPIVLAGPTCDSADILYEKTDYRLPLALKAGDKVVILSTGAYTTTYSSIAFNGMPPLASVCI